MAFIFRAFSNVLTGTVSFGVTRGIPSIGKGLYKFAKKHPKGAFTTVAGLVFVKSGYQELWRVERDIQITEKYTKIEGSETLYMIADQRGRIYRFDNSHFRLHYTRAEEWAAVQIGDYCHVSGVSVRSPFFGLYPRIFKATPIDPIDLETKASNDRFIDRLGTVFVQKIKDAREEVKDIDLTNIKIIIGDVVDSIKNDKANDNSTKDNKTIESIEKIKPFQTNEPIRQVEPIEKIKSIQSDEQKQIAELSLIENKVPNTIVVVDTNQNTISDEISHLQGILK
jgi:hypothetical protein